ncbi:hypothetical protein F4678DRAFT_33481 [Xylaria arbuscula]|nr:hypothetical protein F4678DRAFT_33481 [Xylaria arbuscula]
MQLVGGCGRISEEGVGRAVRLPAQNCNCTRGLLVNRGCAEQCASQGMGRSEQLAIPRKCAGGSRQQTVDSESSQVGSGDATQRPKMTRKPSSAFGAPLGYIAALVPGDDEREENVLGVEGGEKVPRPLQTKTVSRDATGIMKGPETEQADNGKRKRLLVLDVATNEMVSRSTANGLRTPGRWMCVWQIARASLADGWVASLGPEKMLSRRG